MKNCTFKLLFIDKIKFINLKKPFLLKFMLKQLFQKTILVVVILLLTRLLKKSFREIRKLKLAMNLNLT